MALSKAEKSPNFQLTCILLVIKRNDREKYLNWKEINNVRMVVYNSSIVCKNKLRIITMFTQNL